MHELIHGLTHTLEEVLILIPFLFIAFLIIELFNMLHIFLHPFLIYTFDFIKFQIC